MEAILRIVGIAQTSSEAARTYGKSVPQEMYICGPAQLSAHIVTLLYNMLPLTIIGVLICLEFSQEKIYCWTQSIKRSDKRYDTIRKLWRQNSKRNGNNVSETMEAVISHIAYIQL